MTDPDYPPSRSTEGDADPRADAPPADVVSCDVCDSADVTWLRCKLICSRCHTILMTCGDL
jgi:hypothetical protein